MSFLLKKTKVLLPHLHILMGIVKNFIKSLKFEGPVGELLKEIFPKISEAKLKDIVKLIKSEKFTNILCGNELDAWRNIVKVKENFLGSFRSQPYEDIISCIIDSFDRQGVKISLKIHFLDSHVKFYFRPIWANLAINTERGFIRPLKM